MNLRQNWARLFSRSRLRRRRPAALDQVGFGVAEVLESRKLLAAAVANLTLVNTAGALSLTATDIYDSGVKITRSGTNVVFTASPGTQITLGNSVLTTQTISLASAKSLTVNLGSGNNTVTVEGLSLTGDLTFNGVATGSSKATLSVSAGTTSTTIGGSINANLGVTSTTFNLFGSVTAGANLTVTGSVNVNESSSGLKQINLAGPLNGFPLGGKLSIGGNVAVTDTGLGKSGLLIDAGVTIAGNVKFDNSTNTVSSNTVEIYSSSLGYGVTSIAGTLDLKLSSSTYAGNTVKILGVGTPLPITKATTIFSGGGADTISLANTSFANTLSVNTGTSPSYNRDIVKIDGSTFTMGVTVSSTGAFAELDLGTDKNYGPTTFKSTFAAFLTGASSQIFLSNVTSNVSQVVFLSNVTFVGGTPAGTYYVQGLWTVTPTKFVKTNFSTTVPTAVKATVKASVTGNNLTLTSSDALNPVYTVTRSGNNVIVTAGANTQISYLNVVATSQTIPLKALANLTLALGSGISDTTISGLSMSGNLTVNGATTGLATVTINADPANTLIGGSIIQNFNGSAGTLNIYGSKNNGGNLTVTGSVIVTESGSGKKQVNLAGPLDGNPAGGRLTVSTNVSVTDTGNGVSGLQIFPGVTITGSVAFDGSANTVNGNTFEIDSNSLQYGVTSIGGTLTAKTSNAPYASDSVILNGYAGTRMPLTGAVTLQTGLGADTMTITNASFSSTTSLSMGGSPSFARDFTSIDGSNFNQAFTYEALGASARLNIGTDSFYFPTTFSKAFKAFMTGPSANVLVSNKISKVNQVIFSDTVLFSGGTPNGTLTVNGLWSINFATLTRTKFDLLFT